MKKILAIITIFVLLFSLNITASAASASATLTGPGTVRAGDTITLTFNLKGSGIFGASGTLSYDSSQLTLSGTKQKIGNGWAVEFNGNNFVAYDNNLAKPINSSTAVFTVTFKVKNVTPGTNIVVSYTDVKASDGSADANLGMVTYSKTVAEPLSTENNLESLMVSNATISPEFTAGTTSYTAKVPFSVSKLDVSATAKDGKAKVSINSPKLSVGANKVTVTVTAENGAKKTYTIKVTREQDPNYKASNNNKLSGISVKGFLLSPAFTTDNTKYVIWLPYETDSVTVSGTPADSKASVEVVGGTGLLAGRDNEIKVICIAEDGSKKEYIVVAKRAAAHDGSVDATPEDTKPETTPDESTSTDVTTTDGDIAWWWLVVVSVAALAVGLIGGNAINMKIY